jgi:hypothetical protein
MVAKHPPTNMTTTSKHPPEKNQDSKKHPREMNHGSKAFTGEAARQSICQELQTITCNKQRATRQSSKTSPTT